MPWPLDDHLSHVFSHAIPTNETIHIRKSADPESRPTPLVLLEYGEMESKESKQVHVNIRTSSKISMTMRVWIRDVSVLELNLKNASGNQVYCTVLWIPDRQSPWDSEAQGGDHRDPALIGGLSIRQ